MVMTIYIGVLLLLIYYNTLHFITLKKRIFNIYTIYIITMLVSQIVTHGYIYLFSSYISPPLLSDIGYLSSVLMVVFSIVVFMEFFELKKNTPLLYKIHLGFLFVNILFFIGLLYGSFVDRVVYDYLIKEFDINIYYMVNILLAIALIIVDLIVLRKIKIAGAYYVAAGYISMATIMGYFIVLDSFSTVESRLIPPSLIASTIEFILITYALSFQISAITKKNEELDKMLLLQSRQATFGTMIDTISHQWKQPLNELGLQVMHLNSEILFNNKIPPKESLLEFTHKADTILEFMARTVDTFRNFFKESDAISYVNISEKLEDILLFAYSGVFGHLCRLKSDS